MLEMRGPIIHSHAKTLSNVGLFANLSADEIRSIETRCIWKSFEENQQIIHYKESSSDIYFVTVGTVRADLYSRSGRMVAFRDISAGEFFGELSAIDQQSRSATVEALTSCMIAKLSSQIFWELMKSNPKIMEEMLRYVTSQVRSLTERIYEYSVLNVNNRIHSELLRLCRQISFTDNEVVIDPSPTHFEMASKISTHREAVTRELNRLVQIGLIERQGTCTYVKDVSRLEKLVRESNGD